MTLLLFAVALGTLLGGWVILPIVQRRGAALRDAAHGALLDARARRDEALTSLRELDYDLAAGKLDEGDYRRQHERLEREALVALRLAERGEREAAAGGTLATVPHACGFANPDGSRFCAGCGERLG
ncbi:hypothetical protein BH23GEM4_BH23GEM4_20830 [soil metagenome]